MVMIVGEPTGISTADTEWVGGGGCGERKRGCDQARGKQQNSSPAPGVSAGTLALLRRLGEKGASVTEIATALGVTAGTVSNRIDRLYREGLFARVPHDRDRRSHLVTLMSQGIELTDELYRAIISVHDDFLKSFNDKQASQLSTLLDLCET